MKRRSLLQGFLTAPMLSAPFVVGPSRKVEAAPLTYRTDGEWGAGKGVPLTAAEIDNNFRMLDERLRTIRRGVEPMKWDYLLVRSSPQRIQQLSDFFNERGEEGWELVTAHESHDGGVQAYFKRPRDWKRT